MDIRDISKVELHCHLVGILTPAYLKAIATAGHPVLISPEALSEVYPVNNKNDFQKWLEITKAYQANKVKYLQPILALHVEKLLEQKVVYTELMISPSVFSKDLDSMLQEFTTLKDWLLEKENKAIQVEFLMVIPRSITDDQLNKDAIVFMELYKAKLITGVALVGLENNQSIKRFAKTFRFFREKGLGIEIHAGEHTGPENVWEAIEYGQADRIGHGISLFDDERLLKFIKTKNIHIEFCITSNIKTGSVTSLKNHPIWRAIDMQLNYSISTDDPGIFECDLDSEFALVRKHFKVTDDEFERIYRNALAARFQKQLRYL